MANANARGRRFEVRLSEKEESAINNLETWLKAFEGHKIPPKRFAEVILEDPIMLAQHRDLFPEAVLIHPVRQLLVELIFIWRGAK
jgi:hypothetical protein